MRWFTANKNLRGSQPPTLAILCQNVPSLCEDCFVNREFVPLALLIFFTVAGAAAGLSSAAPATGSAINTTGNGYGQARHSLSEVVTFTDGENLLVPRHAEGHNEN